MAYCSLLISPINTRRSTPEATFRFIAFKDSQNSYICSMWLLEAWYTERPENRPRLRSHVLKYDY